MGALSIVTIDAELLSLKSSVLRQPSMEIAVESSESLDLCRKLALEMFEALYAVDGAAIAAPQVGISLRLIVMDPDVEDFGPHVLINPTILYKSEAEEAGYEGCLSLPRFTGKVFRATETHVQAYNLKGELEKFHVTGWLARVFQHEIDHLDGFIYPDRMKSKDKLAETDVTARRKAKAVVKTLLR